MIKIKELYPNMEHYLKEDCYCPGEIYDLGGFLYQYVDPEDDCELFYNDETNHLLYAFWHNQILIFKVGNDKIHNATRVDATENNIKEFKMYFKDTKHKLDIDEFEPGATTKTLSDILALSDAVMVDYT